jgi:hypothetical protein
MLSFEAEFLSSELLAERSLLLCFEASLPYFERALLPGLQRAGAGAVTLLVDHRDLAQSHADLAAVTRVGVDYTIRGIRLPGSHAASHAKLYLLLGRRGARLLVASANLTPSGARTNLEVIDRLALGVDGSGDRAGFTSYLELLAALPRLDITLPPDACRALARASASLRDWLAADGAAHDGEPELLHSAERPLLPQLTERVPADEVSEIVALSPFYDGASRAVLELAAAYPRAQFTLVKDAVAQGDLNGAALARLGDRVTVERLDAVDGRPRRLHAKALMLFGPRRAWLLVGSANLTAPAWLAAAAQGGNLEAVTLRQARTRRGRSARETLGIDRLLMPLQRFRIAHAALIYLPKSEPEGKPDGAITIYTAIAEPGILVLRCATGEWVDKSRSLVAYLASQDYTASVEAHLRSKDEDEIVVDIPCAKAEVESLALSELAVVVTLEAMGESGVRWVGRAWLEKPDYLRLSADGRTRRHALAIMSRHLLVPDVHLHHVAEWLLLTATSLVAELSALALRPGGGDGNGDARLDLTTGPDGPEHPPDGRPPAHDDDIALDFGAWEEMEVELDDEPLPGGRGPGTGGFARVDAYLRGTSRLIGVIFEHDLLRASAAAVAHRSDSVGAAATQVHEAHAATLPEASPDADRLLSASAEDMGRAIARVLRIAPAPDTVDRVADTLDILLAYLFRLELHARLWESPAAATCAQVRHKAWNSVWSVEGWERAQCAGWMVRAWADPKNSDAVRQRFADADRAARIAALLAAGAAMDGSGHPVPASLVVGISLTTQTHDLTVAGPLGPRLRRHAHALAAPAPALLAPEGILGALKPASLADTSGAAVARPWLPVAAALARPLRERERQIAALRSHADLEVRRLAERCLQQIKHDRSITDVVHRRSGAACGECEISLSRVKLQRLAQPGGGPQHCEACGALLVPIAWTDPVCASLLEALRPSPAGLATSNAGATQGPRAPEAQ